MATESRKRAVPTVVMAIINMTPDSFSGDGLLCGTTPTAKEIGLAVDKALKAEDDGAGIIDIGGESTRPPKVYGEVKKVDAETELARVLPLIAALKGRVGVPISVDTRRATVAREAVKAGATIINDVGMLSDSAMASVAASDTRLLIGHWRNTQHGSDIVGDVVDDLEDAVKRAVDAGVPRANVMCDIGLGFNKNVHQNLTLLRAVGDIRRRLGTPLAVGASRKSFVAKVTDGAARDSLAGDVAIAALAVAGGADIVRAHDIAPIVKAVKMSNAVIHGWNG